MTGLFVIAIIIVLFLVILFIKSKGKDPNNNATLTTEERNYLEEDYISHGTRKDEEDTPNL